MTGGGARREGDTAWSKSGTRRSTADVSVRVLGLLEVAAGGEPVELRAPKVRSLLAILALHPGQVVSADRLIEALWGEEPPPSANGTLQTYISKLRSLLGAQLVQTRPPGYVLSLDPEQIDACRFEGMVRQARAMLRDGAHEPASALYLEALTLWRGEALADFTFETFAQSERARLEEARLVALEDWAESELAMGRHAELVGRLRALADEHPLRERFWGQLIVALYRCGRQAEALRTYAELRTHLADDLGIEPSVALQRLEEAVLLQKPELDCTPQPWAGDAEGRTSGPGPATTTATARDISFPARLDTTGAYPLVGRDAELDQLDGERLRAASDGPRLALIAGEPGVGKTRLASEVAARAHRDGAIVLFGRCDEALVMPYQPFAEAAVQIVRQLGPEQIAGVMGSLGSELVRLAPELADFAPTASAPAELDAETARHRMFAAVVRGLSYLCQLAPVVLVLDDVQWATRPTLILLRYVLTSEERMPLYVVATYRDTEPPAGDADLELLWDLERLAGAVRTSLHGLDEAGVRRFVVEAFAGTLPDRSDTLVRSIHADTGGNPLFIGELVRHLVDPQSGVASVPELPEGVVGLVRRRLSRLPAGCVRLLQLAAVVGVEFDVSVVQAAAGVDDDALVSALDEGIRAGLIVEVPSASLRQRFTHGLVRAALYEDLTAARRALLHRSVGEAIENVFAGRLKDRLPDLAYHFAQAAQMGTAEKAATYAVQAGDRASHQLAYEEAVTYFQEALRLLAIEDGQPDVARRFDVLLALTDARNRAGDHDGSKEAARLAADDARLLASPERLARVAQAYDRMGVVGRPDAMAVSLCEEALAALGSDHPALRSRVLAQLAYQRYVGEGNADAADTLSDEALELARRSGDLDALESALHVRAFTLVGSAQVEQRLLLAQEILDLPGQSDNARVQARGTRIRALARLELGDLAGFEEDVDRLEALGDTLRYWVYRSDAAQWRTLQALLDGRFGEVEALIDRMTSYAGTAPNYANGAIGQRIWLLRELGRFTEARTLIGHVASAYPGLPVLRALLALLDADLGDVDEARRHLDGLAHDGFARLPRDFTWMGSMSCLAELCFRLEDRARAEDLYTALLPHQGHLAVVGFAVAVGTADRYLAMLAATIGDWAQAEGWFASALQLEERIGSVPLRARTCLAYGRMLLRRDGPADAGRSADLVEQARAGAASVGAAGLLDEIDRLVRPGTRT